MNLAELGALMRTCGPAATVGQAAAAQAAQAATIAEAMGQRMVAVPRGWDWEEAAECVCGLLLAELPRAVKVKRQVLVLGQPRTVVRFMTHAHIAPGVCVDCWEQPAPCGHHPVEMCDTPEPEVCAACLDAPARMGGELCGPCAAVADGPAWEPDRYYGL